MILRSYSNNLKLFWNFSELFYDMQIFHNLLLSKKPRNFWDSKMKIRKKIFVKEKKKLTLRNCLVMDKI